jgi:adenylyltransferase/sulfurtransferase
VRNHNEGHAVTRLEYEAAELAEGRRAYREEARAFCVTRAACVHRVGSLGLGDVAVWVGVSAAHRDEAFRACRFIIMKSNIACHLEERHYVNGDSGCELRAMRHARRTHRRHEHEHHPTWTYHA